MKLNIPLERGDRVIASFPWKDKIIISTELGSIFIVEVEEDRFFVHAGITKPYPNIPAPRAAA